MKKRMVLLCVGMLALSFAACGKDAAQDDAGQGTEQTESGSVQDSQEGSGEGEDDAQGNPSQDEIQDEDQGDGQGDQGGEADGGSGFNYEEGWSPEMAGIKAAVTDQLGDGYWPDMQVLPDMLEMSFGITSDMYEDYMAEMPMISANVDTLLIVKAKDGKVDAVREALDAYRDMKVNDTMQYPMNVGKIQASRVETIGSYVIFVQLGGDTQEAIEQGDEAVVTQCQEVNDSVIEIIRGQVEQAAE